MVSLGCEKLQPERLLPPGTFAIVDERNVADVGTTEQPKLDVVCLQDDAHVGFMSMIDSIMTTAEEHLERLDARRREPVPASELVVGVQCGGSDAFSGVTANPAVGFCSDLLVRAGATVMFSEVTEVRDGIDQLTARATTPAVAEAMIREMAWYDAYLDKGRVDRSANTTPGNKKGGLSNIVERHGLDHQERQCAISGVLSPGEKLRGRGIRNGLVYAARPPSDFICDTLQLAAGMNLHVFTTGPRHAPGACRGAGDQGRDAQRPRAPLALPGWTSSRPQSPMARDDRGRRLGDVPTMLDVASGRKKTLAEQWKLHNALVLSTPRR